MLFCFVMYDVVRWLLFFFFFQAEDGIRDVAVTGVQTCALPICGEGADSKQTIPCHLSSIRGSFTGLPWLQSRKSGPFQEAPRRRGVADSTLRSEERRVGKECRSRWSPYH